MLCGFVKNVSRFGKAVDSKKNTDMRFTKKELSNKCIIVMI